MNQNTNVDQLRVVVAKFVMEGWIMLRLGGRGWLFVIEKKCIKKSEKWGKGEKGQFSGHKLNITNNMINRIIPLVTPSIILLVKILRHRIICLFEIPL
jgi:hypothetical protein